MSKDLVYKAHRANQLGHQIVNVEQFLDNSRTKLSRNIGALQFRVARSGKIEIRVKDHVREHRLEVDRILGPAFLEVLEGVESLLDNYLEKLRAELRRELNSEK